MNLKPLYNHFAKHPEGNWVMRYDNAVDLYNFVIKHDIKKVLGLGTGIGLSDAIIALAWKQKGVEDGVIHSMEQYDKCIALAEELIPEELKKYIKIHKSEVKLWTTDKIPYQYFSIYENLHEEEYDLILNDGPAPFIDKDGNYIELPNGTIHKLTLEGKIKPGSFVVYDGRVQSITLLERYFASNYYVYKVPKRGSDFFLLQRKDNEAKCEDERYIMLNKNTLYFKNHEQKKDTIPSDKQSPSSETETAPGKA